MKLFSKNCLIKICNYSSIVLFSFFFIANNSLQAQSGETLNFDGVDDYIEASQIPQLTGTQTLTIEFWVKPFTTPAYKHFFSYQSGTLGIQSNASGNNLHFQLATGTSAGGDTSGGVLSPGTWTHVAAVFDGTQTGNENRMKMYIDGIEETLSYNYTVPASLPTAGGTAFHIGKWSPGDFGWINAEMDELRVWDIALSESEIVSRKDCELTGEEDGLVAYYAFNEGTAGGNNAGSTTLPDISGNGIDGTLQHFALDGSTSNWVGSSIVTTGNACSSSSPVPTMGEWALIIFGLMIASLGTVTVMRWQREQKIIREAIA